MDLYKHTLDISSIVAGGCATQTLPLFFVVPVFTKISARSDHIMFAVEGIKLLRTSMQMLTSWGRDSHNTFLFLLYKIPFRRQCV